MTSSMSKIDAWLPPPSEWRVYACRQCSAKMRAPMPPSDGLCAECRDRQRQPAPLTVEQRLAAAGAPRKYAALTRASWERKYGPWAEHPQFRQLVGWPDEDDRGSWLVFIFSNGYGDRKTGLGTSVLGEALCRGLRGRWVSQSGWLREVKTSWNGGEPEHVVWRRAADAEVLLIDDLGGVERQQQVEKAWWRVQVTQLLHHREAQLLPTIVTANLSSWRQVRRIHESLVSRMDVPLKIALRSSRDYRAEERRSVTS